MPGKFWPKVRRQIWAKAQELFQTDEARTMGEDFKGITAERSELRESGYYATAKTLVLIEINQDKKDNHRSEGSEHAKTHVYRSYWFHSLFFQPASA